jgi:hypothetical protein
MKTLLFVLALLCTNSAWAENNWFQARCEAAMGNTVTVLIDKDSPYTIDNSRSFRDLTALKPQAHANAFVLGVTRAQGGLSVDIKWSMLRNPLSAEECLAPKLVVYLHYTPITIYIGSEFEPGTCAYQEILAHEMRHLKVYLDHLPKVETSVRKALGDRFAKKPRYARVGQGGAALQREIETSWMPYMKRELEAAEAKQAGIDSPEEYARLSRVCQGEVQSLIGPVDRTR